MIFGSVCSGIEAASVAWEPLGWRAAFTAEIAPFPSALLAQRFPHVPNLGDITQHHEWGHHDIDVLVGGTPCQSFSISGLRAGMADPRGNLALVYLGIVDRYRPRWVVWENVPGVLSSDGGRAFGAIVGALGELGYGYAWRVLDAQFCRVDGFPRAVPQQRRRCFLVGHLGGWAGAAAVLFDPASLSGDPPPRRGTATPAARPLAAGSRGSGGYRHDADTADRNLVAFGGNRIDPRDVATALTAAKGPSGRLDPGRETVLVAATLTAGGKAKRGTAGRRQEDDSNLVATSLLAAMKKSASRLPCEQGALIVDNVAHTLRASGFDASEDGTGRGTPLVVGFNGRQDPDVYGDRTGALDTDPGSQVVAFQDRFRGDDGRGYERAPPAVTDRVGTIEAMKPWNVATQLGVRRLMPVECERLQGFPDGWTDVSYRGKPAKDGPRYEALGNSMAVPVMRWIGRRIELVERVTRKGTHP